MSNFAYIDGQNLHSGIAAQKWKLDHKKFREYLRNDLNVSKAYIFIGFMEEHQDLYNALQEAGFILFFKPLVRYDDGNIKGNVDADMVLKCMIDINDYEKAVIVSGDGDFAGLIRHLTSVGKLGQVIIPNRDTYSSLFKRMDEFDTDIFIFMRDLKNRLQYISPNYKRPDGNKPAPAERRPAPAPQNTRPKTVPAQNQKPKPAKKFKDARPKKARRPQKPEDRLLQAISEAPKTEL